MRQALLSRPLTTSAPALSYSRHRYRILAALPARLSPLSRRRPSPHPMVAIMQGMTGTSRTALSESIGKAISVHEDVQ